MINLLEETRNHLKLINKRPSDITFIGSVQSGYGCTWLKFCKLANHSYDNGYGGRDVAADLVMLYNDGTHSFRGEYDGSEWWEYQPFLSKPEKILPIKSLFGCGSLARINGDDISD